MYLRIFQVQRVVHQNTDRVHSSKSSALTDSADPTAVFAANFFAIADNARNPSDKSYKFSVHRESNVSFSVRLNLKK